MSGELQPIRCGCSGDAIACDAPYGKWFVQCHNCKTGTKYFDTKEEAIETWNAAMGSNFRTLMQVFAYDATCGVCDKKKVGKSRVKNIVRPHGYPAEGICGNCKEDLNSLYSFCPYCGSELIWEDDDA